MPLYVDPVANQAAGVPFTITGSYDCAAPPLEYSDNNSGFKATSPTGTRVVWRFVHPGLGAGTWAIRVRYPNTAFVVTVSIIVGGGISPGVASAGGWGITTAVSALLPTSPFSHEFSRPPF